MYLITKFLKEPKIFFARELFQVRILIHQNMSMITARTWLFTISNYLIRSLLLSIAPLMLFFYGFMGLDEYCEWYHTSRFDHCVKIVKSFHAHYSNKPRSPIKNQTKLDYQVGKIKNCLLKKLCIWRENDQIIQHLFLPNHIHRIIHHFSQLYNRRVELYIIVFDMIVSQKTTIYFSSFIHKILFFFYIFSDFIYKLNFWRSWHQ